MRTPTHIRRTAARLATGSLLTTLALGLVAAPGMAEGIAPATPGPHTIEEDPVPGEDMFPEPDFPEPDFPEPAPGEEPTGFPLDEIPLPDDVHEPPFPFDPGEVPFPFDPGSSGDDEGEDDEAADDDAGTDEGSDESDGSDDAGEDSGDASEDGDDGTESESGEDPEDAEDTEVAGSSTEADEPADEGSDEPEVTTAGGDDGTPTPTRVDAGAGGSVLTIDRQGAILALGLALALGLVVTGGVLLTRSTNR